LNDELRKEHYDYYQYVASQNVKYLLYNYIVIQLHVYTISVPDINY